MSDAFVERTDVRALIAHVEIQTSHAYDVGNPNVAPVDLVGIRVMEDSRLDGAPIQRAPDYARRPLSDENAYRKFEVSVEVGRMREHPLSVFGRSSIERISARELIRTNRNLDVSHIPGSRSQRRTM